MCIRCTLEELLSGGKAEVEKSEPENEFFVETGASDDYRAVVTRVTEENDQRQLHVEQDGVPILIIEGPQMKGEHLSSRVYFAHTEGATVKLPGHEKERIAHDLQHVVRMDWAMELVNAVREPRRGLDSLRQGIESYLRNSGANVVDFYAMEGGGQTALAVAFDFPAWREVHQSEGNPAAGASAVDEALARLEFWLDDDAWRFRLQERITWTAENHPPMFTWEDIPLTGGGKFARGQVIYGRGNAEDIAGDELVQYVVDLDKPSAGVVMSAAEVRRDESLPGEPWVNDD